MISPETIGGEAGGEQHQDRGWRDESRKSGGNKEVNGRRRRGGSLHMKIAKSGEGCSCSAGAVNCRRQMSFPFPPLLWLIHSLK
jgi:hypothetical protein